MLFSDTLSRSVLSWCKPEFTENSLIHYVHFVIFNLPISETHLKQFQLETRNDPILQTLITYTSNKWPDKYLITTDLLPYYTHRSDITFCEDIIIIIGIIVLTTLRAEMKFLTHQWRLGMENSKKHARKSLFWPLMNSDINVSMVNLLKPLTQWANYSPPSQACTKITADLFRLYGHYYLLMIDYHSKFVIIKTPENLQSSTVINKSNKIFSQIGTPKKLVTDNGPEPESNY